MSTVIIRNGLLVGPVTSDVGDVIMRDGLISEVGVHLETPLNAQEIDATGCWVGPALVDLHAHLREPGFESAETIASGAAAAAMGGYGAVVAMPNTEPAIDNVALVTYVLDQGARTPIDVAVAGAITRGRKGLELAPMAEMASLGVRLFTDDGAGVQNAAVMRRALEYARPLGVCLAQHCEDADLVEGGVMNESAVSSRLGLMGRPALAEELMIRRDLELVRATSGRLHFLHLSTAASLELVARGKADGLAVTCEVAPHHFTLDERMVESFDPLFKVHPPLRSATDVAALRAALSHATIDAVATDHAPHAPETKDASFDEAPAGMLGLEHAAALTYEALGAKDADPVRFFSLLSRGPAGVAQLRASDDRPRHGAHGGALLAGEDANVVVFDPQRTWTVDATTLKSRSRNTPYHGRAMVGKVRALVAKGEVIVNEGELT